MMYKGYECCEGLGWYIKVYEWLLTALKDLDKGLKRVVKVSE